ncbi:MAG: TIGR04086 family membrane protein [Oscillospiraceae bacterium]
MFGGSAMKQQKSSRRTAHPVRNEQGMRKYGAPILKAVTLGLLVTTVLLLLFAFIMSKKDLPFALVNPLSVTSLIAGSMLAGFLSAHWLREHGMTVGALCGLILFLLLLLASAMTKFEIGTQALMKLAIAVISGAIGGVAGVNAQKRRK